MVRKLLPHKQAAEKHAMQKSYEWVKTALPEDILHNTHAHITYIHILSTCGCQTSITIKQKWCPQTTCNIAFIVQHTHMYVCLLHFHLRFAMRRQRQRRFAQAHFVLCANCWFICKCLRQHFVSTYTIACVLRCKPKL